MQQIVEHAAAIIAVSFNPRAMELLDSARQVWGRRRGELVQLPADEKAQMVKMIASVGANVSNEKTDLAAAYKVVSDAAKRYQ